MQHLNLKHELIGHVNLVANVAFDSTGKYLVSSGTGRDRTTRIWDIRTCECLVVLEDIRGFIDVSPTDALFALGEKQGVTIRDIPTGEIRRSFGEHSQDTRGVAYSPDGRMLVTSNGDEFGSGDRNDELRFWDTSTGELLHSTDDGTGPVSLIRFSLDGRFFATRDLDAEICIWDSETLRPVRSLGKHSRHTFDLRFMPNETLLGTRLCFGGSEMFAVWDLETGAIVRSVNAEGKPRMVGPASVSPCGMLIAMGSTFDGLSLWDAESMTLIEVQADAHTEGIQNVAFSPCGGLLASCGGVGTATLEDWETAVNPIKIWSVKGKAE